MLRQLPLPPSPPSPLPLSYAICWLNHRIAKIVFRSLCLYLARSQLSYVDARVFAAHTHIFYMEKQLSVSTSSEKRRQITQSMGFNSFDSAMISSVFQWCTNKLAKWFMLHTATICVDVCNIYLQTCAIYRVHTYCQLQTNYSSCFLRCVYSFEQSVYTVQRFRDAINKQIN